jgi:uncharacterized membrane protein
MWDIIMIVLTVAAIIDTILFVIEINKNTKRILESKQKKNKRQFLIKRRINEET